jgi:hypothetical protein
LKLRARQRKLPPSKDAAARNEYTVDGEINTSTTNNKRLEIMSHHDEHDVRRVTPASQSYNSNPESPTMEQKFAQAEQDVAKKHAVTKHTGKKHTGKKHAVTRSARDKTYNRMQDLRRSIVAPRRVLMNPNHAARSDSQTMTTTMKATMMMMMMNPTKRCQPVRPVNSDESKTVTITATIKATTTATINCVGVFCDGLLGCLASFDLDPVEIKKRIVAYRSFVSAPTGMQADGRMSFESDVTCRDVF